MHGLRLDARGWKSTYIRRRQPLQRRNTFIREDLAQGAASVARLTQREKDWKRS